MFEITGARISLTRGDTAALHVEITREGADGSQTPYVMDAADTLTLTAKKSAMTPSLRVEITSVGSPTLDIRPEHTKHLPPGDYVYDIQLKTAAGDVYTVIGPGTAGINATLRMLPEVGE